MLRTAMLFLLIFSSLFCFTKSSLAAEDLSHITDTGGTVYFADDFESGYQYLGSANPYNNYGYFSYLGGSVLKPEGIIGDCMNIDSGNYHYTVISTDQAKAGTHSLKTPYDAQCTGQSTSRDATQIIIPGGFGPGQDCYVRFYQMFTGSWNDASVQHKLTKFYSSEYQFDDTMNGAYFTFGSEQKYFRNVNTPNKDGRFNTSIARTDPVMIYADPSHDCTYTGCSKFHDDLDNVGDFEFNTNKWYAVEIHFKLNSNESTADGEIDLWIDGEKKFEIRNFKYYTISENPYVVDLFEFQHIYYDRDAGTDDPTYMDNIVIADKYIGPVKSSDQNVPASPSGLSVS